MDIATAAEQGQLRSRAERRALEARPRCDEIELRLYRGRQPRLRQAQFGAVAARRSALELHLRRTERQREHLDHHRAA
jgi:hypothetical protein